MMTPTREAFWWSLFSAGGVMAALFVPAFIVATGLVLPFIATDPAQEHHASVHGAVSFWLVRLVLWGVIGLAFFHCAHRIRHIIMDLGARWAGAALLVLCYGGALAGTIAAAVVLWGLNPPA